MGWLLPEHQPVRGEAAEAPQSVSGAFLTLGSALQDLAGGWSVGSAGMLKPLASSRAASSVSCGQGKEYSSLLVAQVLPRAPEGAVALASQSIFLYLLPMAAVTPSQGARGQVWVIGTEGPQLEQQLQSDWQDEWGQVCGGTVR